MWSALFRTIFILSGSFTLQHTPRLPGGCTLQAHLLWVLALTLIATTLCLQIEFSSHWPSICAFSHSLSSPMLQWESRPDGVFPGKIIISHTRVTFLHASGNSVAKQGTFLFLAIGNRSTDKERILGLLQPLNRWQNLESARRSLPLLAGINAHNPGNSCMFITQDLHGWSGTKWEGPGLPCQVPEHLSTAPLPTHPPLHAADAHMHPFFICSPKDALLPGRVPKQNYPVQKRQHIWEGKGYFRETFLLAQTEAKPWRTEGQVNVPQW